MNPADNNAGRKKQINRGHSLTHKFGNKDKCKNIIMLVDNANYARGAFIHKLHANIRLHPTNTKTVICVKSHTIFAEVEERGYEDGQRTGRMTHFSAPVGEPTVFRL